ncbi:uncharacterized protein BcabD6B2_54850 [Babesia caballi]|uniref:Uncharacterized protein n=1 Tax=Babesia caballi TaxID=5871 RepID=A0AAV4M201_BABCB|nr:hypothetical protein, conserved [Babesia caballi]
MGREAEETEVDTSCAAAKEEVAWDSAEGLLDLLLPAVGFDAERRGSGGRSLSNALLGLQNKLSHLHLLSRQTQRVEAEGDATQVAGKAVLFDVDAAVLANHVLQNQHVVRLLGGFDAAEDAGHAEGSAVRLLAGVDNEGDVDVLVGGEPAELLNGLVLDLPDLADARVLAAQHELQVVDDDVAHVVHVDGVVHGVNHLVNRRGAVELHEAQGELGEPVGVVVEVLEGSFEVPAAELAQHGLRQADVVDFEGAPKGADALHAVVQGKLRQNGGLPRSGRAGPDGEFSAAVALQQLRQTGQGYRGNARRGGWVGELVEDVLTNVVKVQNLGVGHGGGGVDRHCHAAGGLVHDHGVELAFREHDGFRHARWFVQLGGHKVFAEHAPGAAARYQLHSGLVLDGADLDAIDDELRPREDDAQLGLPFTDAVAESELAGTHAVPFQRFHGDAAGFGQVVQHWFVPLSVEEVHLVLGDVGHRHGGLGGRREAEGVAAKRGVHCFLDHAAGEVAHGGLEIVEAALVAAPVAVGVAGVFENLVLVQVVAFVLVRGAKRAELQRQLDRAFHVLDALPSQVLHDVARQDAVVVRHKRRVVA